MRGDRQPGNPAGSVLIEVLIALVLLAVAGSALAASIAQTEQALRSTAASERATEGASRELERLVAWDRSAMVAHEGRSYDHDWMLDVRAATPELFDVAIADSDTSIVLLRTTYYRPDTADVPR